MTAAPASHADPAHGLLGLLQALAAAGLAVGPSEAIDATDLLLKLAARSPDPLPREVLRAALRPALCKQRDQREAFDGAFDRWWQSRLAGAAAPPAPPPQMPAAVPGRRGSGAAALAWGLAALLVVGAIGWAGWQRTPAPTATDTVQAPVSAGTASPAAPRPVAQPDVSAAPIEGYVPAVRENFELRAVWAGLLAALPLAALVAFNVPALALRRQRGHRGEALMLDAAPLEAEARRLVPPLDPLTADRLARHVRASDADPRRAARRPRIDVRRTLEATLRRRGVPTVCWTPARVHPSYLLLVDAAHERDPRGRLFFQWALRLARQGLDVRILALRRDPKGDGEDLLVGPPGAVAGAVRAAGARWQPLRRLAAPPAGERLIVVSDGDPLVDADGRWRRGARRAGFASWPDRALFTPLELRDWGAREQAIERRESAVDPGFTVLPLDESALRAWTALVLGGRLGDITLADPQRFPALLRRGGAARLLADEAPPRETLERLFVQLRLYLGEQGLRWMAALAIVPIVRWELTLLLGRAVLMPSGAGGARAEADALSLYYRRLVKLPWLQQAALPDWLRLRLLLELSLAEQQRLREAARALLARLAPRPGVAGVPLGFDRAPSAADAPGTRPADGAAPEDTDAIYLGTMGGLDAAQLLLRAPERWRDWLHRVPLPAPRGWRERLQRWHDRGRSAWARQAWRDGLPHLGPRPASLWLAPWLLLPLVAVLGWAALQQGPPQQAAPAPWFVWRSAALTVPAPGDAGLAAFLPGGEQALIVGRDGRLRRIELATGAALGPDWQAVPASPRALAVSPDGQRVAVGGDAGELVLLDTATGAVFARPLVAHAAGVAALAFTADGERLVSAGADGELRQWEGRTGNAVGAPIAGGIEVHAFALASDGAQAVLASRTGGVQRVWLRDGSMTRINDAAAGPLAISPDGRQLVQGDEQGGLRRWTLVAGQAASALAPAPAAAYEGSVSALAFTPDGRRLVGIGGGGQLALWDAVTLEAVGAPVALDRSARSFAMSGDGRRLLVFGADGAAAVWTAAPAAPLAPPLVVGAGVQIAGLAIAPDGRHIAAATGDGRVLVFDDDVAAPRQLGSAGGATAPLCCVAFTAGGSVVLGGAADGTLAGWDPRSGAPRGAVGRLAGRSLTALAASADGTRVVSGSADGGVQLHDADGTPLGAPLRSPAGPVSALAVGRDGSAFVSGHRDGRVLAWATPDAAPRAAPTLPVGVVASVALSADGALVAAGYDQGVVIVWPLADTGSGAGRQFKGLGQAVASVAFTAGDRRLVAVGVNGRLLQWDVANGNAVGSPVDTGRGAVVVGTPALSPDGRWVALPVQEPVKLAALQDPKPDPKQVPVQQQAPTERLNNAPPTFSDAPNVLQAPAAQAAAPPLAQRILRWRLDAPPDDGGHTVGQWQRAAEARRAGTTLSGALGWAALLAFVSFLVHGVSAQQRLGRAAAAKEAT